MAVMAMFPLGSVLLPGGVLPLHVFEPRYREMVRDCLRADGEPEFGQALITHGWETGGGDDRVMVGTVAQMLQVDAIDENRYALVAVGTRRIRINAWLPDDPYPIADVDDWPDEDPDAPGLAVDVAASHARVRAARALATQVSEQLDATMGAGESDEMPVDSGDDEISDDPLLATYHLGNAGADRSSGPIPPARRTGTCPALGPAR